MVEYIVVFVITTFLISFIRPYTGPKKTFLLAFLVIIIVSLFCGVRANHVGTDTASYPLGCFLLALKSQSFSVFDELVKENFFMNEIGYIGLVYFVSRFTYDFNVFLFICGLLVNVGVVVFAVFSCRKFSVKIGLVWLTYLAMLFNQTLNVAKQSIALSLCLIAFVLFCKNFKKMAFLTLCIGVTFHFTAFVFLFFLLEKKIKSGFLRIASICIVLLTVLGNYVFLEKILGFSRFLHRFHSYTTNQDGNIAVGELIFKLAIIFGFYFLYKMKQVKLDRAVVMRILYLFSIETSLFLFNAISAQAGRISMYFIPAYFIFVPYLLQYTKGKKYLSACYVMSLFAYWFVTIVYQGSTGSYPYVSVLY